MKRYVKVTDGFVVADDRDMTDWRLDITEDTIRYHMEYEIERKAQEIRLLMEGKKFDLVSDEQYLSSPRAVVEREMKGVRVLVFARKGKWQIMTREQITAETP